MTRSARRGGPSIEGNDIVTPPLEPARRTDAETQARTRSQAPAPAPTSATEGIEAVGVSHHYDGHGVLHELSLGVERGSFCTLLGPSGSGKTTLLRIFAGLLEPSAGHIRIEGREVTRVPVQRRSIGFVFQHYALFPHLTVADNIAYPLKVRGYDRSERKRMVNEMIEFADLGGLANRHPGQLSGGQQQRVAIARALVFRPQVLLLDEPLGALDRRLRQQLGADLRRIQKETATTAVYVTHDQEEALLLSDTIAVMEGGVVRQVGSPVELYSRPVDRFVATFLGDTNLLSGEVREILPAGVRVAWQDALIECGGGGSASPGERRSFSIRPENVELFAGANGGLHAADDRHEILGSADVVDSIFLGGHYRIRLDLVGGEGITAEVRGDAPVPEIGDRVRVGWLRGAAVVVADAP